RPLRGGRAGRHRQAGPDLPVRRRERTAVRPRAPCPGERRPRAAGIPGPAVTRRWSSTESRVGGLTPGEPMSTAPALSPEVWLLFLTRVVGLFAYGFVSLILVREFTHEAQFEATPLVCRCRGAGRRPGWQGVPDLGRGRCQTRRRSDRQGG